MKTLLIACGNPLRGDDGVAHEVVTMLRGMCDCRQVQQLTPEVATELKAYDQVIFVDADIAARAPCISPLASGSLTPPGMSHRSSAAEIVELGRTLFGFAGEASVCHIPAHNFSFGEELSEEARDAAVDAARQLACLIMGQRMRA